LEEHTPSFSQIGLFLSVFGVRLNRGNRMISQKWKENSASKLMKLRFQLVPHPPYSPDLALSDYYLFPNMKKQLAGRRFYSNEVIAETNAYFAEMDQSYYSEGINKVHR